MKLIHTSQLDVLQLLEVEADAFIAASGFESRARHAATKLLSKLPQKRICLAFNEGKDSETRKENDNFFKNEKFDLVSASESDSEVPEQVLEGLLRRDVPQQSIIIDISSMTRVWYAGFVNLLRRSHGYGKVDCYFVYSPASFAVPTPLAPNEKIEPLDGFCSLDVPSRPTALVIGLGYERGKALALKNYIDPALTFAFLTDPAFDPRFVSRVRGNNEELLSGLDSNCIIQHPADDLGLTAYLLSSLIEGLIGSHKVILAPLGIKPFTLLCLLLSCSVDGLDVWRVTSGTKAVKHDHTPFGPLLTLKAVFSD